MRRAFRHPLDYPFEEPCSGRSDACDHRALPGVVREPTLPSANDSGTHLDSYNAGRRGANVGPAPQPAACEASEDFFHRGCAHDGHRSLSGPGRPDDAPESQVTRRRVDRLGKPGCRPIAAAVVRRAQVGAPFDHLAGSGCAAGADRSCPPPARPAGCSECSRMRLAMGAARCIPVGRPLPDVAGHVEEAVSFGGNASTGDVPRIRRSEGSATGTLPARNSPSAGPPASTHCPRRIPRRRARRGPRTPTRLRSGAISLHRAYASASAYATWTTG